MSQLFSVLELAASRKLQDHGFSHEVAGIDYELIIRSYAAGLNAKPQRGILLSGAFGCGKTMAVCALYANDRIIYRLFDANVVETLENYDPENMINRRGVIILDDVGAEPEIRFRKKDFVGDYLMKRHDLWLRGYAGLTVITTNLDAKAMAERYGGRVMSRVLEMCVPVRLAGGDHRKRVTV